jgi:hypothetical protein
MGADVMQGVDGRASRAVCAPEGRADCAVTEPVFALASACIPDLDSLSASTVCTTRFPIVISHKSGCPAAGYFAPHELGKYLDGCVLRRAAVAVCSWRHCPALFSFSVSISSFDAGSPFVARAARRPGPGRRGGTRSSPYRRWVTFHRRRKLPSTSHQTASIPMSIAPPWVLLSPHRFSSAANPLDG